MQSQRQDNQQPNNNQFLEYTKAIFSGAYSGLADLVHSIAHPLDDVVYPMTDLIFDATVIAAAHMPENAHFDPHTDDMAMLNRVISQNPQIYTDAKNRMKERAANLHAAGQAFVNGTGPQRAEMITAAATNILVPGWIVKGAKVAAKAHYFRTPFSPPLFHNTRPDVITPPPFIKN